MAQLKLEGIWADESGWVLILRKYITDYPNHKFIFTIQSEGTAIMPTPILSKFPTTGYCIYPYSWTVGRGGNVMMQGKVAQVGNRKVAEKWINGITKDR